MDCNQLVELMLHTTEEFQMFLMAYPDGYSELSNANITSYAMIKLSMCGGLYTKDIERLHRKTKADKNIWAIFCQNLISEYEKLLAEGGGTTLGQEGYRAGLNSTEATMKE